MKKSAWILVLILSLMMGMLNGCANGTVEGTVSLAKEPVAEEKIFEMAGTDTLELAFTLPEAGGLKLLIYDATDYEEEPEEYPEGTLSFYDEEGEVLYEGLPVTDGYIDRCSFEAGEVTARIIFSGETEKLGAVAVSWAYAPERKTPTALKSGETTTAMADTKGKAVFTAEIESAGLYTLSPAEACIYESDCYFTVKDETGKAVTERLMIHGTEWNSRTVFLPKGTYTVEVEGVQTVVTCKLEMKEPIDLESDGVVLIPGALGFTTPGQSTLSATFTTYRDKTTLTATADGIGTYYDSEQPFTLQVLDSAGKTVVKEECEGSGSWEIGKLNGDYTVHVTSNGGSLVKLDIQ